MPAFLTRRIGPGHYTWIGQTASRVGIGLMPLQEVPLDTSSRISGE